MRGSAWRLVGVATALLTGVTLLLVGAWKPGQVEPPENGSGTLKPFLAEAKTKSETVQGSFEKMKKESAELSGFKGQEGEHRVFVSAQLVYLQESAEPVQPLDRKMKTRDGIEVGWKIKYGMDPADPKGKEQDPDGDGFTNLEEYLAGTDPTRKEDSPAKESKLKSRSGEAVPLMISFSEKSGGMFTIRFQVGAKRKEFRGKPGDIFWIMAGPEGMEIFSDEGKMMAARNQAKEAGRNAHVIPVQISSYGGRIEKIRDAKAGGVEIEVDNSFLIIHRKDCLEGPSKLGFSTPTRPQTLSWDVGEVRFYTPTSGGLDLGPFRLGEAFTYEDMEFAIVGREDKKIQLQNRTDSGKQPFWVPPEVLPMENPVTP